MEFLVRAPTAINSVRTLTTVGSTSSANQTPTATTLAMVICSMSRCRISRVIATYPTGSTVETDPYASTMEPAWIVRLLAYTKYLKILVVI